jgi:ABC-type sugar transport system permease subunit
MWMTMFNNDYGVINEIIEAFFGESSRINWYTKPAPFFAKSWTYRRILTM